MRKRIKSSGKKLKAIYVSYGDPDFYFGLEVFKKYFPDVIAYATPATVEHIKATAQGKLEVWGARLGNAITSNVVLPQVLPGSSIELEGHQLEIRGLAEFPAQAFVWIPSIKAVVGGISVFGNTCHLWMADTPTLESRHEWLSVLDRITALQPDIVTPAHATDKAAWNLTSVKHTQDYIEFYEEALKTNKTSESLIKAIKARYPDLTLGIALEIGAKVNTGELDWVSKSPYPAIGHRVEVNFGEISFMLDFKDHQQMNFKGQNGATDSVEYTATEIAPNVFMVYWHEPHVGDNVVHIQDFNQGVVYTNIASKNGGFLHLKGTLKILN